MRAKQGQKKTAKQDIGQPAKQRTHTAECSPTLPARGRLYLQTHGECYLIDPNRLELHGLPFEGKI